MILVVTALESWSDGNQALFAFIVPALLVWWQQKRRSQKQGQKQQEAHAAFVAESSTTKEYQQDRFGHELTMSQEPSARPKQKHAAPIEAEKPTWAEPKKVVARYSNSKPAVSQPSIQGWVSKGQLVNIAGREIDGMVYVGTPPQIDKYGYGYREKCRAYIDPSLSVASFGSDHNGDGMDYWPGYSTIPSTSRATYLDWLSEGRTDGSVNPGYMFLFFYGLERRFLLENPSNEEKQEILAEVERLKSLFSENYSCRRYLSEFIDLAYIASAERFSLDDPDLRQSILESHSWDLPFSLKFALGGIIANGSPIDAEWLHLWLVCHPERRFRTPAERCAEEFKTLFKLKFDERFPEGLKVRKPSKLLKIEYRAASGEFDCSASPATGEHGDVAVPDVSNLYSPIRKAQEIADEAMDDLDKYSRYLGRNPNGRGTIEAQALLPSELWQAFPSEELDELKSWAGGKVESGGLVPVVEVIAKLEGEQPTKIGKRQLTGAADALARLGFGMAPDPRFSLRGPKIDEPVVIFELGQVVDELEDVSADFRSTLFEVALATFVAHADGQIVETERMALNNRVEQATGTTDLERQRLRANLNWYLNVPPDISWLRSKLKKAPAEHHTALRAAIVGMALADTVVGSEEVASIEKIYKALGIDTNLVYADLHAGEISDEPVSVKPAEAGAPGEIIPETADPRAAPLDAARIAAIRRDTERVSTVLGEIFTVDDDAEDKPNLAVALSTGMVGLDPKLAGIVEKVIEREHWTEGEFVALTKSHGQMASGALEAINEWAYERFDEALIDEYNGYDVAAEVAGAIKSEFTGETV